METMEDCVRGSLPTQKGAAASRAKTRRGGAPGAVSEAPTTAFDEIWIEWNGMVPFAQLQNFLLQPPLRDLCQIRQVIHIADAAKLGSLWGRTGGALPEQIANSDFAVVRNAQTTEALAKTRKLLSGINPGIPVCASDAYDDFRKQLVRKKHSAVNVFFLLILLMAGLYLAAEPALASAQIPVNKVVNVFLGILLQAIPFLLIGVLLSSALEIFVSKSVIERRVPKNFGLGMVAAILAGFFLPVCDCASIPIFRSLVKKGIPVPVAITFITATPVINPVVILSTYYAFGGDMRIVIGRICLGIISAVLIGFTFAARPPKGPILSSEAPDMFLCSCGYYGDVETVTTFKGKTELFFRHAQAEFFNVGKYLVIGTFVSAVFQTIGMRFFSSVQSGAGLALSLAVMMLMGFVLSLCSSSDAVVARSFANQFPTGALMGFLVFGPMMDIKSAMMLSSCFSKRFIARLAVVTFVICFAVVFLFSGLGGI
jgi:uncharacterized membrane protein YraQ (UPF0718 family)